MIKLGGKLPLEFFSKHKDARKFFGNNTFGDVFFASRIIVRYDSFEGLIIPVEVSTGSISWFVWESLAWRESEEGFSVYRGDLLLFKTNKERQLTSDYFILMNGIVKYNVISTGFLRPYKQETRGTQSKGLYLNIGVNWDEEYKQGSSYILNTHAFMELIDKDGYVISFGQDIFDHVDEIPKYGFLRASVASSIISSPDRACYYPHNFRTTKKIKFPISKKEHDRIISIVESDRYNSQRTAELLKGNCVSYVTRIIKLGLNYHISTDVTLLELLGREFSRGLFQSYVVKLTKKFGTVPKWAEVLIYLFPPVYFVSFLLGIVIMSTSFSGYKNYRKYNLLDCLFKPWKIRCDVPRIMYKILSKYADENGEINRKKYPSGYTFD